MQPKAYLVLRTIVPNPADRPAFDKWYQDEHIPAVLRAAGPRRIIRAWNTLDPSEHVAMYGFPSAEAGTQIVGSKEIGILIAEFDQKWDGRTSRSRSLLEVAQDIDG